MKLVCADENHALFCGSYGPSFGIGDLTVSGSVCSYQKVYQLSLIDSAFCSRTVPLDLTILTNAPMDKIFQSESIRFF